MTGSIRPGVSSRFHELSTTDLCPVPICLAATAADARMHANDLAAIATGPRDLLLSEKCLHTMLSDIRQIFHRRLEKRIRGSVSRFLFHNILTRIRRAHVAIITSELPKPLAPANQTMIEAKIGFSLIRPVASHAGIIFLKRPSANRAIQSARCDHFFLDHSRFSLNRTISSPSPIVSTSS